MTSFSSAFPSRNLGVSLDIFIFPFLTEENPVDCTSNPCCLSITATITLSHVVTMTTFLGHCQNIRMGLPASHLHASSSPSTGHHCDCLNMSNVYLTPRLKPFNFLFASGKYKPLGIAHQASIPMELVMI